MRYHTNSGVYSVAHKLGGFPMSDTVKASGHCLCGAVKISASQASKSIGACHCGMCRRWTGGPWLALPNREPRTIEHRRVDVVAELLPVHRAQPLARADLALRAQIERELTAGHR